MDKLYSRPRIRIPKVYKMGANNKDQKNKKVIKVIVVILIAFITIFNTIKAINPMFNTICKEQAKGYGTEILNIEASKLLEGMKYDDFVKIEKDNNGNIKMIQIDTVIVNKFSSNLTYNVQTKLYENRDKAVSMPIGAILGNKYLAGWGPRINIKILPVGSVSTEFKSEFKTSGINQTIHRLYLDTICKISIITPYDVIEHEVLNKILLSEAVIVGQIPEAYYNLEGIDKNNTLELID